MFDQALEKSPETDRMRSIVMAAVVVVMLAVAGVGLYFAFRQHTETPPQPGLVNALHAGNADYDAYAKQVAISNQEAFYSTNALGGTQIIATGRVQNFGNRTIKGLEVRAVAYDFDGKPLATQIAAPIPRATAEPLQANGTLPITVRIDKAPDEGMVQSIKIELTGLMLQ